MRSPRSRVIRVLAIAALCAAYLVPATPAPAAPAARPASASGAAPLVAGLNLSAEVSGDAAVQALGAKLHDVAMAHGKSAAELAKALREDRSLHVSRSGRLVYKEAPITAIEAAAIGIGDTIPASAPLADTFKLHSKPGSKRTIYLDFDGYTISGTSWNYYNGGADIVAPAWDIEGGAAVFTDLERTRIQSIWKRVAEDYAPFDVDVTTELTSEDQLLRSSIADDVFGQRVLVSAISSYFGAYGGLSSVAIFGDVGVHEPSLVFPERLSNSEKAIGEASSHEAGHSLALLHDGTATGLAYYGGHGTGETGWAPIMGTGYSRNLTQWSKGEYASPDNREDDIAIIQANGCPLRTDDHADSSSAAVRLAPGTAISAAGLIGRTGDVDVVAVTAGAGPLALSATPAALGPNLDIALEVRDEAGALVASANPADALGASLSANVSAGTYFVSVRGTGKGDPLTTGYTDYASLGQWTLTGTAVDPGTLAAPVAAFSVSAAEGVAPLGVTFNASGSYDPDGSIVSYAWSFGDGASATGALASHTYTQPGTYSAVLTVTDNDGQTASSQATIVVVAPNVAPTAAIAPSVTSGVAPLAVAFNGAASADVDGSIASYAWDFGDGASATGAQASHTFAQAGDYTVTLTVTDNDGATATSQCIVHVTAAPLPTLRVAGISVTVLSTKAGKVARADVRVVDEAGRVVQGATVSGMWSGAVFGTSSALTAADGIAPVTSKAYKKSGTVSFAITQVSKAGYKYDASANAVSQASYVVDTVVTRGNR